MLGKKPLGFFPNVVIQQGNLRHIFNAAAPFLLVAYPRNIISGRSLWGVTFYFKLILIMNTCVLLLLMLIRLLCYTFGRLITAD